MRGSRVGRCPPRSGHGAVRYRGKIFCMGGEGYERVYGQNEVYDPATDR